MVGQRGQQDAHHHGPGGRKATGQRKRQELVLSPISLGRDQREATEDCFPVHVLVLVPGQRARRKLLRRIGLDGQACREDTSREVEHAQKCRRTRGSVRHQDAVSFGIHQHRAECEGFGGLEDPDRSAPTRAGTTAGLADRFDRLPRVTAKAAFPSTAANVVLEKGRPAHGGRSDLGTHADGGDTLRSMVTIASDRLAVRHRCRRGTSD